MRLQSGVNDPLKPLAPAFEQVRLAGTIRPPQFIPWVIWQYGLGELTPYVPTLNQLIDEGVRWQRVRGTPAAIYQGLNWIGYGGAIEEAAPRRRRWHRFQVRLNRVRDADTPDLARIDGIVGLSPPARSRFARGFHGHDVRAAETAFSRTGAALLGSDSGVRLPAVAARWSFGRTHERTHDVSEAELTALDAWIEPVPAGDRWVEADYPWIEATIAWNVPGVTARRNAIAEALIELGTPFIRFRNAMGGIIGHARAVAHKVLSAADGPYRIGAARFAVTPLATEALLVAARTGFGDGAGQTAASMAIVLGAEHSPGIKPGARWIGPAGLTGGVEIATTAAAIPFGQTVRERPIFLLRF
jgi:hypothetical protein